MKLRRSPPPTPSLSAPTLRAAATADRRVLPGEARSSPRILLSLVALLFLVPIIWMVLSALKPSAEVFTVPPKLFGSEILFSNFAEAWNYLPFGRFILNTIWVAGVGTLITLVASATAGYAFARLNFKFQGGLFILYLSTLIVPQEVIVIPMFLVMQQLGWVNSYKALILPWAFTAFGTFLLPTILHAPSPKSSRKPPRSMAAGTSASSAASSSRWRPRLSPSWPSSPSSPTGTASCGR